MTTETTELVEHTAADLIRLLRSDSIDPHTAALGDWSVRDVAAHLAGLMRRSGG